MIRLPSGVIKVWLLPWTAEPQLGEWSQQLNQELNSSHCPVNPDFV